jgi:hypothetical protein
MTKINKLITIKLHSLIQKFIIAKIMQIYEFES